MISVLESSLDSATSTLMILTLLFGTLFFTVIGFVQVLTVLHSLSIRLSINLSVCLCLSISLAVCLPVFFSVSLSPSFLYYHLLLNEYFSVCLSISLSVCLCLSVSFYLNESIHQEDGQRMVMMVTILVWPKQSFSQCEQNQGNHCGFRTKPTEITSLVINDETVEMFLILSSSDVSF